MSTKHAEEWDQTNGNTRQPARCSLKTNAPLEVCDVANEEGEGSGGIAARSQGFAPRCRLIPAIRLPRLVAVQNLSMPHFGMQEPLMNLKRKQFMEAPSASQSNIPAQHEEKDHKEGALATEANGRKNQGSTSFLSRVTALLQTTVSLFRGAVGAL